MDTKYGTEIINAHAHIYPAKIAERATRAVGDFYDVKMRFESGTAEALIKDGKPFGVTRYVVHSCATTAHQVRAINEFIKAETDAHKEFIGFMTLHQDLTEEEIYNEVSLAVKNGFKGIKLHPDFQKFYVDGADAEKIYRAVDGRLPILLHIGDNRFDYSKPARLASVAKKFTNTEFICAHMGGYFCWDDADVFKGLENVYFDTCSSLPFMTKSRAKGIIDKLGAERFFFGTDFPMWDTEGEIDRFFSVPLKDREREAILAKNIKRFLHIE